MDQQELITAEEVASFLRVKVSTIYDWAAKEILPHVRILAGKRRPVIRFRRTDLQEFIQQRMTGSEEKSC